MKTELNFLEVHFIVDELQSLVGARIDKIYQPDGFLFQIHKPGSGKVFLRISDKVMFLCKEKPLAPETMSGLCSLLRKFLEGKKITSIEQLGSERIVKLTFQTQKETFFLYVELFANNIILTDGEGKIFGATEERAWKDREIKRGLQYVAPPAKRNLFELSKEDIVNDEKTLASLGFGKTLAKEIIARGGDFKAYQSLIKEKISPRAYADGELSPIKLAQYSESGEPFSSFSELIDSRLSQSLVAQKTERIRKSFEEKKNKLKEVIDMQSKGISAQEKYAVEFQRKGELIYEHYQELKEIIEELNKAKTKFSLQEIKAKLKGHAKIKDLNPRTSDVIVELKD